MNSTLCIAGAALRISTQLELYYPEEAGPTAQFARKSASTADINIAVEVRPGTRNDFDGMKLVAEAESAWRLVDDGDDQWFVSAFKLEGMPAWAARMGPRCNSIMVECNSAIENGYGRSASPLIYPLDQLLMIHIMATRRGLLVHGSGIMKDGKAVVLAGVSGAGKTTVSSLIDGTPGLELLSDDRVFIREQNGRMMVYGTPWPGEGGYALNEGAELCGLGFLKHGDSDEVIPMESNTGFERLMPVSSVPWYDEELMTSVVEFAGGIVSGVPVYDFVFSKDGNAADLVESMIGENKG
ncbi:hypothetical protein BVX97_04340 [bacterium E08(2017)]|nr:hypothetical protein BVX97_04340 [bacterium E08(2017)]